MIGSTPDGGSMKAEIWDELLSWRKVRDWELDQAWFGQELKRFGVGGPAFTLRSEATATFTRDDLCGHPRDTWIELAQPGNCVLFVFPDITVAKYTRAMELIGLREGASDEEAEGLLYSADGPLGASEWAVLRAWETPEQRRTHVAEHLDVIREFAPKGPVEHREFAVEYVYYTRDCPAGGHNRIAPGFFH